MNDGNWAKSNQEKAAIFKECLAEIFSTPGPYTNNNDKTIQNYLDVPSITIC